MSQIISNESLQELIRSLISSGTKVAAPVAGPKNKFFFQYLKEEDTPVLDTSIMPTNSIKEFFFPRSEVLYRFKRDGKEISVQDVEPFSNQQIIFGARPCDAASLPILDPLFAWDYQDRFYQSRRENTTVVTLVCDGGDENCFCTSLGLSPESEAGSDVILLDLGDGNFEVRTLSEKGEKLFVGKTVESDKIGTFPTAPEKRFDPEKVRANLKSSFDNPIWEETSLRCVGCGACTYICPTCHCFDMVDEGGSTNGRKVKNWDTCQFALFTIHASGHNPRSNQAQRQRQRIQHKFNIYPEKFGLVLCTGCGNCTRDCLATLGVRPVLEKLAKQV